MTALAGRVAVVTGGASGIGRATVLRFLEAGARVVFGDLNEPNSEALVAEVAITGRLATFQPWPDLGQPGHIASIALFLAGPDSEFVTGTAIPATGAEPRDP